MTTNINVNPRARRGLILADLGHVKKIEPKTTKAQLYKVRSETNHDILYSVVQKSSGEVFCDCADFQNRGIQCKHIYAVAFAMDLNPLSSQFILERGIKELMNKKAKPERIDISGADF